jgi:hypothetical protein
MSAPVPLGAHLHLCLPLNALMRRVSRLWLLQPRWRARRMLWVEAGTSTTCFARRHRRGERMPRPGMIGYCDVTRQKRVRVQGTAERAADRA